MGDVPPLVSKPLIFAAGWLYLRMGNGRIGQFTAPRLPQTATESEGQYRKENLVILETLINHVKEKTTSLVSLQLVRCCYPKNSPCSKKLAASR